MTLSRCQASANQTTQMNESYPEYISLPLQDPVHSSSALNDIDNNSGTEGAHDKLWKTLMNFRGWKQHWPFISVEIQQPQ